MADSGDTDYALVNATFDIDQETETLYYSFKYRIIGTFFNSIIFIFGVFGNLMVVAVVKRNRSMHSPTNCYLVSLSGRFI
ncbi:UNVERIFIED_CONTAM: hypothetical protein PYX00_006800 [Menopon gallinae]|uniref:Uncharacterized protein n=1 Tax=Menopon gallinae TaxID=328185 RepID=A0AAW2HXI7_9NEOP